jgi:putative heme iron utilization protein
MGSISANASPQGEGFRLEAIVKEPSAGRAAELVRRCKVAALGTLHHGAPSVSMVPYAIIEDPFAFVVLVSALSAHTNEMLGDPNVALMIMEPETDAKPPHTLARVSIQGRAEPISYDDPRFGVARVAYSARFPDMVGLFELGDFMHFAITPATVRVIAGFAQAASITPASIARSVRHAG